MFDSLKMVVAGAEKLQDEVAELFKMRFGKEILGKTILEELNVIRIWTKKKGQLADKPMIMPKGATVKDVAEKIHSEFVNRFKFALVERKGSKISKIRAGLGFQLMDGDIVTIYTGE